MIKARLDRWLGWVLAVLMGAAVINVLWQVFSRYVLNRPSSFTEELARYLLIWIAMLGAAYASGSRMHLSLDLLEQRLRGRARLALHLLVDGCIVVFAMLVLVIGGTMLAFRVHEISPALGIHKGIVYAVLPVSGVIFVTYAVIDALTRRPTDAA